MNALKREPGHLDYAPKYSEPSFLLAKMIP
jgi:hypothetical protein